MRASLRLGSVLAWIGCSCLAARGSSSGATACIGVDELYRRYAPGDCGGPRPWEGAAVRVRGYVDPDNIFDRYSHPGLPYEKFTLRDERERRAVEVWVTVPDSAGIFRVVRESVAEPRRALIVSGTLSTFEMPTMSTCRRGLRVNIARVEMEAAPPEGSRGS